jgi:predicted GIY-YIG superfamily endonuclease
MNSVYIIYSPSTDKFYIEETEDLVSRLFQHHEHAFFET